MINTNRLFKSINLFYKNSFQLLGSNALIKSAQEVSSSQFKEIKGISPGSLYASLRAKKELTKPAEDLYEYYLTIFSKADVQSEAGVKKWNIIAKATNLAALAINSSANEKVIKLAQYTLASIIKYVGGTNSFIGSYVKKGQDPEIQQTLSRLDSIGMSSFMEPLLKDTGEEVYFDEPEEVSGGSVIKNIYDSKEGSSLYEIKNIDTATWNELLDLYQEANTMFNEGAEGKDEDGDFDSKVNLIKYYKGYALIRFYDQIGHIYANAILNNKNFAEAFEIINQYLANDIQYHDAYRSNSLFDASNKQKLKNSILFEMLNDLETAAQASGQSIDDFDVDTARSMVEYVSNLSPENPDVVIEEDDSINAQSHLEAALNNIDRSSAKDETKSYSKTLISRIESEWEKIRSIKSLMESEYNLSKFDLQEVDTLYKRYHDLEAMYPALLKSAKELNNARIAYKSLVDNKTNSREDRAALNRKEDEFKGLLLKKNQAKKSIRRDVLLLDRISFTKDLLSEKDPHLKEILDVKIKRIDLLTSENVGKKGLIKATNNYLSKLIDPQSKVGKFFVKTEDGDLIEKFPSVLDLKKSFLEKERTVQDRYSYNKKQALNISKIKDLGQIDGIMTNITQHLASVKSDFITRAGKEIKEFVLSGLKEDKFSSFSFLADKITDLNDKLRVEKDPNIARNLQLGIDNATKDLVVAIRSFLHNEKDSGWDFPSAFDDLTNDIKSSASIIKSIMNDYNEFIRKINSGKLHDVNIQETCSSFMMELDTALQYIAKIAETVFANKEKSQIHAIIYSKVFLLRRSDGDELNLAGIAKKAEEIRQILSKISGQEQEFMQTDIFNIDKLQDSNFPSRIDMIRKELFNDEPSLKFPGIDSLNDFIQERDGASRKTKEPKKVNIIDAPVPKPVKKPAQTGKPANKSTEVKALSDEEKAEMIRKIRQKMLQGK